MAALPRQCAILVGGLGSRLGGLTRTTPKPLLEVGGRPFLAWVMREALRWGIEDFVLLAGHLGERVEAAAPVLAATLPRPVGVRVSREPAPAGTGGALRCAAGMLDDQFLLLNGDSLFLADLGPALAAWGRDGAETRCRMILRRVPDAGRSGVTTLRGDRVTGLAAADPPAAGPPAAGPPAAGPPVTAAAHPAPGVLVNAGMYLMRRCVAEAAGPGASLEHDVLPALAAAGALAGTVADGWFIDIGVPDDLAVARAELPARARRPALLVDRDGVLNLDHGYVGSPERWDWTPGAIEAIRRVTAAGWHVFIVTNQSGVGRGMFTEHDVRALHRWAAGTLRRAGGTVDDARYCPYHPEATVEPYRRESDWRKPGPGMILDLIRAWELDPARCVLVGDQPRDMAAAAAAGIAGHRFTGGDLARFVAPLLQ
jgi:D-glycero-D-manno-heptose 1,7-bisphosphate phosphatase